MRHMWMAAALTIGCSGGESSEDGPTWHGEVAPVMASRCGDCHYDGGPGNFDARDLEQVRNFGPAIVDAVESGRMPPFAARPDDCDQEVWFREDGRLRDGEKDSILDWIAADMPEGKARDAAPIPDRRSIDLEDPDIVVPLQEPFAVDGTRDIYQCFRIEVPADGDRWITGMQVLPDNDKVVHHALIWSDPYDASLARAGADGSYPCSGEPDIWPTELIGTWTPGGSPMVTPENTGVTFRNGSTLVVNIHYHPTGNSTELDQTEVAFKWTSERPDQFATWFLVDIPFGASEATPPFLIPPDEESHVEEVVLQSPIPMDLPIFAIAPHMHYLGVGMKVMHETDSGDSCLVHTPDYRFDFQQSYFYDAPVSGLPTFRFGDRVRVQCEYNNSMTNPYMPLAMEATGEDGPIAVGWGEETGDEMCMAMVGLISPVEVVDWLSLL